MIRVDIESIVMTSGPIPSILVLRERKPDENHEVPLRSLSIQTGSFEAAAVGRGIEGVEEPRPITHDLTGNIIAQLGARIERVEINRVDEPVFFSTIVICDREGGEHEIDARPSDALALAVRANAPIYVEDDVMNRAGNISLESNEKPDKEIERFDEFVQTLSPDDF